MAKIITVELDKLAESVGVSASMFTPPIPNARPMKQYNWDGKAVEAAGQKLRETYPEPGTELAFLGHVDVWITLALAYAVEGTCKCYFASPNHDENNTFCYVGLDPLPVGEPPKDIYFSAKMKEEGDFVFLEYAVDDPAKEGHSFFNDSIPKLVVPPIPAGKRVCLHGGGIYPVQWAVSNTYKQISTAIFTAAHEDKAYTCAWCADGAYQVGDQIPRAEF